MEETTKTGMPVFTKIAIGINILLFGITGIYYLANNNVVIGSILLAAGITNVIYSLVTVKTNNYFFVVLNFLFAAVAFIVCLDFLLLRVQKETTLGLIWMIITMVYLVVGFILLLRLKNKKPRTPGQQ
jgi:hypothetical protein